MVVDGGEVQPSIPVCQFTEEDHVIWLKALVSKKIWTLENKYDFSKWISQSQKQTYIVSIYEVSEYKL